jgi:HEAT repeat protein
MPYTTADPLPELVQTLAGRSSPAGRLAAAQALGRIGPKARDAIPALLTATTDDDAKVRVAAVQALGHIGPDAIFGLAQLLTHSDKYVRRNATWGLGKLGSLAKGVLKDLCRALKDPDPRTAAGAAQALGAMHSDAAAAVPALTEAMRGTNVVLCRLAAKALSEVGQPAIPDLICHLSHHDPFVRGEAAVALGWIGPDAAPAVPALVAVLSAVPKVPLTQTPPPASKSDDTATPEDNARMYAAQSLGRIGPAAASALSALAQALHDPHVPVGTAAQLALKQIRGGASPA